MLPQELLRKVRKIEITTRKKVDDALSGRYRSHFKGHGVQFSEHRQYVAGDDVRHIDWKVSARSRDPLIRKYEEERELVVLLVVDISGSKAFGSIGRLKSEMAAEVAGLIAYAASRAGDKVGALFFGGRVERVIPPRKGRSHVLRIIREVLDPAQPSPGTDLAGALDAAGQAMSHRGIVFVLSDFLAPDYGLALRRLAKRHDVVAVTFSDRRESELPAIGRLLVVDPETGAERWVDTGSYAFRKWFDSQRKARQEALGSALKSGAVESLSLSTHDEDYVEAVVRFFRSRARKR